MREAVTIIGSNGAGKSIAGTVRPTSDTVVLAGHRYHPSDACGQASGLCRTAGRSSPGSACASTCSWVPTTVVATTRSPRHRAHLRALPDPARAAAAVRRHPSPAAAAMMVIGRALMRRPKVLLLDEPSLGLAPIAVQEVVSKLKALVAHDTTILLVEQNARAAFDVAQRGYVLTRGEIILDSPVAELEKAPRVQAAYLGV